MDDKIAGFILMFMMLFASIAILQDDDTNMVVVNKQQEQMVADWSNQFPEIATEARVCQKRDGYISDPCFQDLETKYRILLTQDNNKYHEPVAQEKDNL